MKNSLTPRRSLYLALVLAAVLVCVTPAAADSVGSPFGAGFTSGSPDPEFDLPPWQSWTSPENTDTINGWLDQNTGGDDITDPSEPGVDGSPDIDTSFQTPGFETQEQTELPEAPEPGSFVLAAAGVLGLMAAIRRGSRSNRTRDYKG